MCSSPLIALPCPNLPRSVDTHAFAYEIGWKMFQAREDGACKPIVYRHRPSNDAERNYSAPERELIAVVWAFQTLRTYLQYEKFNVLTHHYVLKSIFNITDPSVRLTPWILRLADFDFKIKYQKIQRNQHASAFSRLLIVSATFEGEDDIPAFYQGKENYVEISSWTIDSKWSTRENEEQHEDF